VCTTFELSLIYYHTLVVLADERVKDYESRSHLILPGFPQHLEDAVLPSKHPASTSPSIINTPICYERYKSPLASWQEACKQRNDSPRLQTRCLAFAWFMYPKLHAFVEK
jgi:hypothetical protein